LCHPLDLPRAQVVGEDVEDQTLVAAVNAMIGVSGARAETRGLVIVPWKVSRRALPPEEGMQKKLWCALAVDTNAILEPSGEHAG